METRFKDDAGWAALASFIPVEVEAWAQETGALVRKRRVGDVETLIRLALVHSSGLSLRETAAWAQERGIADFSDVALLKRLRKLPKLLTLCVQALLPSPQAGPRLFILDGSCVSRPIAKGTDFRIHLGWDPSGLRISQVRLSGSKPREGLQSLPWTAGSVVIGDRAYGYRGEIAVARSDGVDVLVRLTLSSLPLQTYDGTRIDLLQACRPLAVGEILELDVNTVPDPKKGITCVPGRFIAIRKDPAVALRERTKAKREATKKKRRQRPETGESAEFLFLFTTLNRDELDAAAILAAYRHRWQIEMLFKRAKGIVGVDNIQARDPDLAATVILAKLVAILLIQKIQEVFSPWGYAMPRKAQPVAGA